MKKLKSKKGFTLMEMLIVVAIIAVLVAIAVPTFNASLTKAKQATDQANIRTAVALITTEYLSMDTPAAISVKYLQTNGTLAATGAGDYKTKAASPSGSTYSYVADKSIGVAVAGDGAVTVSFAPA